MKTMVCGRGPATARACAAMVMGLGLAALGCDGGDDRDGMGDGPSAEHRGECGTAVLELAGAYEGPVTIGDGGLVGAGVCVHGRIDDDTDVVSLDCVFHDPGEEDLVLGTQFGFHINDFEWGPRTWEIEDPVSSDAPWDGFVRYFEYDQDAEAISWITGLEGGRCTVSLSRSSEEGVEGGVVCEGLSSGYDEPPLSLEGTFCVDGALIVEADEDG